MKSQLIVCGVLSACCVTNPCAGKPPSEQEPRVVDVRFTHGDATLAGSLVLPNTEGPHPVVIMVHGSGPSDREAWGYLPPTWEAFSRIGYACLSWDKPGLGKSTGDWKRQTMKDRANEVGEAIQSRRVAKGRQQGRHGSCLP